MLGTVHQERSSYHKDDIFNQDGSFVCWKQHYGHIWVRTNKYCISKVEFIRYSRVIGEAMLSVSCESLPEFYDRGDITVHGCHLQKCQASQIVFVHLAHVIEFSHNLSYSFHR